MCAKVGEFGTQAVKLLTAEGRGQIVFRKKISKKNNRKHL